LEVERARVTRLLSKIKEEEGDISQASEILQDLQVETFGSMDKREKVEFILEQMRLYIARNDFIRTQIISKKISSKFFEDPSNEVSDRYYETIRSDKYRIG
jgi:26S proteasome regulatory subunit N5